MGLMVTYGVSHGFLSPNRRLFFISKTIPIYIQIMLKNGGVLTPCLVNIISQPPMFLFTITKDDARGVKMG
jgi:hypothetical protein